jgi:hypothetical protein
MKDYVVALAKPGTATVFQLCLSPKVAVSIRYNAKVRFLA